METQTSTKTPKHIPHNPVAEADLLGMLLAQNELLMNFQDFLLPEHFFEPVHQRIYGAIRDAFIRSDRANPVTLKRQFDADPHLKDVEGSQYLVRLMAGTSAFVNHRDCAQEIFNCWQRRQMMEWCNEAYVEAAKPEGGKSAEEIGVGIVSRINDMRQTDNRRRVASGTELANEIYNEIDQAAECFSTGIHRLDSAMMGGLYAGYTYGFGGRKKTGKTVLAGTLSFNLDMLGVKHCFICGEMGAKQIHKRMIARHANTSDYAFRLEKLKTPEFKQAVGDYVAQHGKSIVFQNAPGLTFDDLKRYASRAVYRDKVKGIILDYWQLVGGKNPKDSDAKHLDNVAQWIADFSREHNIWSIVFSQMNQEGNTRGGEGLRNACDQFYEIHKQSDSEGNSPPDAGYWMEMKETRYTEWGDIGDANEPAFDMSHGPHFKERPRQGYRYSAFDGGSHD